MYAQDSANTERNWRLNGYVKEMETFSFNKNFSKLLTNNLLHNRINIKWKPDKLITTSLEVRNRMFWGNEVAETPGFTDLLKGENEWLNLSALWVSRSNIVLYSNIDRLWGEIRKTKWNLRLGRQRVNWGVNAIWSPNDIFNTYNFLDFDYEERPGADAAKFQYLFTDQSNVEFAFSVQKNNKYIGAARYFINMLGYDLQILAGIYQNKLTTGFGWAGNLGNVGFKGEGQVFIGEKDSGNICNYSVELSYVFKKAWYLSVSVLHTTSGLSKPVSDWSKINFNFSPVNLMPAKWSFLTSLSKEITPLFSGNLSLVYSPQVNLFILYPSLKYNLFTNFDADIVWQSFFSEISNRFQAATHHAFIRLKWNF